MFGRVNAVTKHSSTLVVFFLSSTTIIGNSYRIMFTWKNISSFLFDYLTQHCININGFLWLTELLNIVFFHPTCYIIKQKCEHLLPLNKLTPLFQQFCVGLISLMFSQTLLAHLATPCCVGKWWWSHMEIILKDCLAGMKVCTHFVKLGSHDDRMRIILFWIK